jgi:membrane-bound lytic murein transglycosylase D
MAITAYNHGVTGMRRARRKKGSYERIFKEYRSRIFRFASRNFYSEFLAAREAAKNYRQYFGELELSPPHKTHAFKLSGYVSLPEFARHLDLDLAELRALNPALRDPVYRGQKYVPREYRLQLPDRNDRDWNQLIARLPRELYHQNQKRSTIYRVRRGDTAGKIAKKHGVKLNDLIAVNNLNRRATIYVKQILKIPLPEESASALNTGSTGRKADLPVLETAPLLADLTDHSINAVVRDSFQHIQPDAKLITEDSEIALIPAQPQPIALNQAEATRKPSIKPNIMPGHFAVERVSMQGGKPIGRIRVEAEETLGHYAEWLNVLAREIRQLNGFRYGRPLQLSQQIKIPLGRTTKEDFEIKRFEYHQGLAEDFFGSYRVDKLRTYFIKRGDNIWTLSRREFEVPLWLIKQYNGHVDFGALIPSQKLLIPVVEKNV